MKFRRTENVKRNIRFGFIQVLVSQLLPFVVRTVIIYRFGVDYLGLKSLFSSILNVLSMMELGFGTAIAYSMYKPIAENDKDLLCAYLAFYKKIYMLIGIGIMGMGIILMPFLKLLVSDPNLPGGLNIYLCYLIFLGDSVISYLLFGYLAVLPVAFQRKDILSRIDICVSIVQCIVKLVVLYYISTFYGYLMIIPLATVSRNLIIAGVTKKLYPNYICKGELTHRQKKELIEKVYGLLITKVMGVSRNGIDSICISAFLGLALNGIYNNYFFVMMGVIAFSGCVCNSMMASVGNSIATESREKNYEDMRLFDYIYMIVATWATVCLICLYQPFIAFWLGKEMLLTTPVAMGMCAYFYILKMGDIRWVYHEGAGLWYECRFIMVGEAIANILLNILLCKLLGVGGIVLATVITVFVTNYLLCPKVLFGYYFMNNKIREYWTDHLIYASIMVIIAFASYALSNLLFPVTMIDKGIALNVVCLGGRLILCTSLSFLMLWIAWHRTQRYQKAVVWMIGALKLGGGQ